ncbi:MAG TPA: HAMP domain-containing histidine kinase, partial [Planctomycetaceae bacterium]|nr:HAMP domain-containing histidine kinase [Planctomycetaceae bacterium]
NPLANISSRAQTLLQQESDPERRRQLATIEAQAYRAYEMIADMMLFAKAPQPNCTVCDPAVLAREVVSELQAAARAQETELLVESADVDGRAWCDRVQIETALRALVQNALEAVGRGGRVTVSAGRDERSWWWTVTDTGPGLSEKARRHLFDPFFSGREAGRGLGLGLSKVWAIARQHGGEVTVDAPAGRGVSIRLAIPVLEPQVQGEG